MKQHAGACSIIALSAFVCAQYVPVCAQYVCPVFFNIGSEIICITKNNWKTPHYEKLYSEHKQNGCEKILHVKFTMWKTPFRNVDCRFEDLRYEFKHEHGSDIKSFSTGRENPNTILRSEELKIMCDVERLVLSGANIEIIESYAFFCLESVSYLDLSYNRIQTLTPEIFEDAKTLRKLNLSSNLIDVLPPAVFKNAWNLTVLNLSSNLIKVLPADVFSGLSNLEDLNLNYNGLEAVDALLFNLPRLVSLHLKRNNLKSINYDTFSKNDRLEILDISHNDISFLSKDAFVVNSNLTELYMNQNRLKEISLETFQPIRELKHLDLSWNDIAEVKSGTFLNNYKLRILLLSKNRLSRIRDGDFSGLASIRTLDIDSNSIETVGVGSFQGIFESKDFSSAVKNKLILSNNKLGNLSNVFSNSGIGELDISKNLGLILSSDTFSGLTAHTISMHACNITFIPHGAFRINKYLRNLDLSNNDIREISDMTFSNLYSLNISYNKIEQFDATSIRGLEILNISHNNLFKLECNGSFGSLRNLDASSNVLKEYTLKTPRLRIANFSHNQISSLESLLGSNSRSLRYLDVSYNKLSHITSDEWKKIIYISYFNAANNVIKEIVIPEPLDNYVEDVFHEIFLQYNKLELIKLPKNLKREVLTKTIKYTITFTINIYLSHNPLICQCSAYKIRTYLKEFDVSKHYINIADELLCYLPAKLEGKILRDLEPTEFWCDYDKDCFNNISHCTRALDCDKRCSCCYRAHDYVGIMDCSNRSYSTLPLHVPQNIELIYMDRNSLTSLAELNRPQWQHLKEIHVEYNAIDSENVPIPKNVTYLGLRGNKLRTFPASIQAHSENNINFKVTLSGNLWPCECSILNLNAFFRNHPYKVIDIDNVTCSFPTGSTLLLNKASDLDLCPSLEDKTMIYVTIGVAGILVTLVIIGSILYLKYKLYILTFLYTKCNWFYRLFCCDKRAIREKKIFDGFICYSSEDSDMVLEILHQLEDKPPKCHFCIHERNWMPGSLITNNIFYSVKNSRKTLVVLSAVFLASKWFPLEFEAAFQQAVQDRRDRMIVILKGDLPPYSEMPEAVRYFLTTRTYLRWGDPWFFDKLRYAMNEDQPFMRREVQTKQDSSV